MHRFHAMNSTFHTAGLSTANELQAESWFAFVERHLSRFKPESELSRLNAEAGYPFYASSLMYQAVREAMRFYEQTGGIFNPMMGQILCELGYDRTMEWDHGSVSTRLDAWKPCDPANQSLSQQRYSTTPNRFGQKLYTLDAMLKTIHLHTDVQLDLGGIAKGWSAQQFANMLQEQGEESGMIDAGGDLVIWGSEQRRYEVEIADPWNEQETAASLVMMRDAGIATSSTQRRSWKGSDNQQYHHLIDPRLHTSAQSEWVQLTVISPSLTESEVYAKCVLIMGAEAGPRWLQRQNPEAAMIGIRHDGLCVIDGPIEQYGQFNREGEWTQYEQLMA